MGDYRCYKKIEEVIIIFAKLISGTLKRAPKTVYYNGKTIFNPPDDVLLELGYLPVTYTDIPTDVSNGQHYESHWEQTDTEIVQVWALVDGQEELEQELSADEALNIIMGVVS